MQVRFNFTYCKICTKKKRNPTDERAEMTTTGLINKQNSINLSLLLPEKQTASQWGNTRCGQGNLRETIIKTSENDWEWLSAHREQWGMIRHILRWNTSPTSKLVTSSAYRNTVIRWLYRSRNYEGTWDIDYVPIRHAWLVVLITRGRQH